nr:MAG TPA: hypothetical protein [Bacteriophage sp.]DAQ57325.1 MAG TPA: hypothetical protein [Bacteriophage sp.]
MFSTHFGYPPITISNYCAYSAKDKSIKTLHFCVSG